MRVLLVGPLLVAPLFLGSCGAARPAVGSIQATRSPQGERTLQESSATIWVKGLACPFCVHNIDKKLREVPGVTAVEVELETGRVVVYIAGESLPGEQELREAIHDGGFTVDRIEMP